MTINKQEMQAIIATLIFWIVMMTVGIIVMSLQVDEPEYKTISISLNTPIAKPVVKIPTELKKTETQVPAAKSNPATTTPAAQSKPATTTPAAQSKPATTTPVAQSKPAVTKPTVTKPVLVPQKLQKSVDELMAQQNATSVTKTTADVDWDSLFADSNTVASSSNSSPTTTSNAISDSEALSGSVATISSDTTATATSSENKTGSKVSDSTSSALNAIGSANFSDSGSGSGVTSTVSVVSGAASSNGTVIQMSDGSMRKLLDPLKPVLTISPENEKLIDSSRLVIITFIVKAEGNILPTSINFTPSGLLPLAVKSDLRVQIAKWRFEKGSGDGQAEFKYSINKQ